MAQEFNQKQEGQNNAALQSPSGRVFEAKAIRLLAHERHQRKLKRGAHAENHFQILLRNVTAEQSMAQSEFRAAVEARMALIASQGFPNYIGPQRFGHGGRNVQRAEQWFGNKNKKKRTSRTQRSLWLSSARSAIFNIVCATRVRNHSWQQLLEGEPAMLDGSKSFFSTSIDADSQAEELQSRIDAFDIHPSAPWWGRGNSLAVGACKEFEEQLLQPYGSLLTGLENAGLDQQRRAIRGLVRNLAFQWLDDETIAIEFSLNAGLYATMVLNELCVTKFSPH